MNEIKRNQTVLVRKNFPFPVVDACTVFLDTQKCHLQPNEWPILYSPLIVS